MRTNFEPFEHVSFKHSSLLAVDLALWEGTHESFFMMSPFGCVWKWGRWYTQRGTFVHAVSDD